jgi:hypothetical protein
MHGTGAQFEKVEEGVVKGVYDKGKFMKKY